MGDLFPSELSTSLVTTLDARSDFERLYFSSFQIGLLQDKVLFEHLPLGENLVHLGDHLQKLKKDAVLPCSRLSDVPWEKVAQRLFGPLASCDVQRKYLNQKTFFCAGHHFLVKKYFTFGLRRTDSGVCHVYHTQAKPLLFYVPDPAYLGAELTFNKEHRARFCCFVLEEQAAYLVPENTTYLILTVDKTFFAVQSFPSAKLAVGDFRSPFETPLEQAIAGNNWEPKA